MFCHYPLKNVTSPKVGCNTWTINEQAFLYGKNFKDSYDELLANLAIWEASYDVKNLTGDWSAFKARKDGEELVVREQVRAVNGASFADVEGWFWQALAGRTTGPWLVISVASHGRP